MLISILWAGMLAGCTPDITQIQQQTARICGFVPTAVVITNFFPNPYTAPVLTVAQAICDAVQAQVPPQAHRRLARRGANGQVTVNINVNGEPISVTGYFVR